MRCFHHPDYFLRLRDGHPFPMEKFAESRRLVESAAAGATVHPVEPAPMAWLLRAHEPGYLESIAAGRLTREAAVKLGLPAGEPLLRRCRLETAGTVAAAEAALEDGIAANLGGGTHHAFAGRGEGYCVLNDVVVALRRLRAARPLRALIVDTDAHQGNGTHDLLAGDPDSFTYSIHVGRNYPSRKVRGNVDVELPRWVPGDEYLERLSDTLPAVVAAFPADLVFWVSGADPHEDDRFGQMRLSREDLRARDRFVLETIRATGAPLVVLYGGGYNRVPGVTGAIHAETVLAAAAMAESWRRAERSRDGSPAGMNLPRPRPSTARAMP